MSTVWATSYAPLPREQVGEMQSRVVPLPLYEMRCHHCGEWLGMWDECSVWGPPGHRHSQVCRRCCRRLVDAMWRAVSTPRSRRAKRRRARMSIPAHHR